MFIKKLILERNKKKNAISRKNNIAKINLMLEYNIKSQICFTVKLNKLFISQNSIKYSGKLTL